MQNDKKILVFDLDGTLVDSARDLVPALNRTTAARGLPPISLDEASHYVGQGAMKMIERAFQLHNRPLDRPQKQSLLARFLEDYERNLTTNTVFYDGVTETLSILRDQQWEFAVCTNKFEHLARLIVQQLGQSVQFPTITGGDTFDCKKPDPDHLIKTILRAGGDPQKAIMIGDSINDIAAAKAAHIPVIAVDFGYSDVPVAELEPDAIISHFSQLPGEIEKITTKSDR